jgi:hypothetical protein
MLLRRNERKWERKPTYILVLAISRSAVSVVERLQHLRTQVIVAIGDVESSPVVELLLIGRHSSLVPAEALRANANQGLVVSVLAAGDELQAEVDVLLFFQD